MAEDVAIPDTVRMVVRASTPALLEVHDLRLAFRSPTGTTLALDSVDLNVSEGSLTAIVGPSGCGKSTLLHAIAGLTPPTSGRIEFREGTRPKIGYVFQQDSLLPWRTAASNIQLALRLNGAARREARTLAAEAMRHFGLAGFERHYPRQLSGGMRKRVALACAMSYRPPLLLMDEPYSALDAQTRLLLQDELLETWARSGATIIFVTHDLDEAVSLADEVVVMSRRPGTILTTISVPLERPRAVMEARADPRFAGCVGDLWSILKAQVELSSQR